MTKYRQIRDADVWDGWAPTEEMLARAERGRPFWSYWNRDWLASIEELHAAFTMRCAASLVRSFDPSHVKRRPAAFMTQVEEDIYGRFAEWLKDIHNAGMKRYVAMVQGVILREDACPDQHLFERLVGYHVKIRQREMQRYVAQKHRK